MKERVAVAAALLLALAASPVAAQTEYCPLVYDPELGLGGTVAEPYVFILLDTSGTMNLGASDAPVIRRADDPASRIFMVKEALHQVLANNYEVRLGFATFNQDSLRVAAKHWLYQAAGNGVSIPGWGPLPTAGAREIFGPSWACDNGTGDQEVGCYSTGPADLSDVWEHERVRRLPKGGSAFTQTVEYFVRHNGITYRVRYQPAPFGALGSASLDTQVTVHRCLNFSCSSTSLTGQTTVTWQAVGDFLSWENPILPKRTAPVTYYPQTVAADAFSTNTCSGWEPNGDGLADAFNGYSLLHPTDSSDPRGASFSVGDVIPLDWLDDHHDDVLTRLAPNQASDPMAPPDFRTAVYLEDQPQPGETFLRLRDPDSRPLVPGGSRALPNAVHSFYEWYTGCPYGSCNTSGWQDLAMQEDLLWPCRRHYLIVLSDAGSSTTCTGNNPCAAVASLNARYNLRTYVVGVGTQIYSNTLLSCFANNGGTYPFWGFTTQELVDALTEVFDEIRAQSLILY